MKDLILTLSVSKVKTYSQCPRKFWYNYIIKHPTKDWEHFTFGIFVHRALELFHEHPLHDVDRKKLMKECCDKAYEDLKSKNKELSTEQVVDAKRVLVSYLKHIKDKYLNVLKTEFSFKTSLDSENGYGLNGVIDRIDMDDDGVLHIRDYKTNKSDRYMDDFQLKAYGIPLFEMYPEVDKFRGSYTMLKLGCKQLYYEFTRDDVLKCKNQLIGYANKISAEERWLPTPSKLCDWCDFQQDCFKSW